MSIEEKWQKKWKEEKIFQPDIDKTRQPFYIQVAYPYPSGAMHIGHARTYTITDVIAKYHMLKGKNVLMPMGWHVSGTPVISSVEALKQGDKKTIKKFKEIFKIPEKDLEKLKTPQGFIDYMINECEYGYNGGFEKLGLGIDWRRELTTIDPQYKKFIQWQYKKLKENNHIKKGKYPVRYCPQDKSPVGDHDLSEGEGVNIQEFILLKFKMGNKYLIAGTLRPETIFGQTNLFVNPDTLYLIIKAQNEKWIVSPACFKKLKNQKENIEKIDKIKGKELLGREAKAPGIDKTIPILPSKFCDPSVGTGIVTSVPSDAPIDYIALQDLKKDEKACKDYNLDIEAIRKIEPIPIIKTKKFGNMSAKKIVENMNIKSQEDSQKIEKATQQVYKEGFHNGIMNKNCDKYQGMKVSKAKQMVKKDLIKQGEADRLYELEDTVVCRCGTECIVRLLEDQWFITYSNKEWKEESKKTLDNMNIVPETFRKQYEKVFAWLEDKPCTRSKGLGTTFPWDKNKVIEPLGDSTIYMPYFTISHIIRDIDPKKLDNNVFDYIFLNKGNVNKISTQSGIKKSVLINMRENFAYWYPLAYNVSAIELIPNHMSFSIFNHTDIFPSDKRQEGTINLGMLILDGKKMSSSKGNVILINDLCDRIGTDYVRFFLINFAEIWEEMDWRPKEVKSGLSHIQNFIHYVMNIEKKSSQSSSNSQIDQWILNRFNKRYNSYLENMEKMNIRKALQEISFKLFQDIKWYKERCQEVNKSVFKQIISDWTKCIAPVMPHISEEIQHKVLQKSCSIFKEQLPPKREVDNTIDIKEKLIKGIVKDVKAIKDMTGITPKTIHLYTAPKWKWKALQIMTKNMDHPSFSQAMKSLTKKSEIKKKGNEVKKFVQRTYKKIMELKDVQEINELATIKKARKYLENKFGCQVKISKPAKKNKEKTKKAIPLKPAIILK